MIKNTGKTEPAVGSDEYMVGHGFHQSSDAEVNAYGKMTKCPTSAPATGVHTAGPKPQLARQSQYQSCTRQNEATVTVVFLPRSVRSIYQLGRHRNRDIPANRWENFFPVRHLRF